MTKKSYFISKHALNRIIERLVLSQNIKLNKKQVSKNVGRAKNIIINDINNHFAKVYSADGKYKYVYSSLNKESKCRKYVISLDNNVVVTVINNLNLNEEIKKYKLTFDMKPQNIIKTEKYSISDYVYLHINNNQFLFVVDSFDDAIYSLKLIEEC